MVLALTLGSAAGAATPSEARSAAVAWLLDHETPSLDYRARAIRALAAAGLNVTQAASDLLALATGDGWGVVEGSGVTSYGHHASAGADK
jgi:hypothetical protein